MDKISRKHILIITIILSLAVAFVPIYYFVLAAPDDDNKFKVINEKIIAMEDGLDSFDADDSDGNDSSNSNNRVRTFDSIRYTVQYKLVEKTASSTSGNVEGRQIQVEVLIPTAYEAKLVYGEEVNINMDDRLQDIVSIGGVNYYYGSFNVPVSGLDQISIFDFKLENINTTDINTANSIKPLVFLRETTDADSASIKNNQSRSDITCELGREVTDPSTGTTSTTTSNNCNATITGKSEFFVNMYSGSKKTDDQNVTKVPIGLLIGLRNQPNGKGIKGLIVPKSIPFAVSNSNVSKLGFNEDQEYPYRGYSMDGYLVTINEHNTEMPVIENGSISGSISGNTIALTVNDIKDYLITPYVENGEVQFYYFSTNYFLTTLAPRTDADGYNDITVNLSSDVNNSAGVPASATVVDSYNFILGNYSSNIDIYEGSSTNALEYGKANINYGSDFTIRTNFDYTSRSDSTGDGLTSLTNFIKIDNDVFKLHNSINHDPFKFSSGETTSVPTIKPDADGANQKVYFGFGEWNANYFDIAPNAPSGCPTSISSLNKEQLMNLYGGPCIVEKNTIQWAYSPESENDRNEHPITSTKGALIVKSTYVSNNDGYIGLSSSGTLELYAKVINDHQVANSAHQIVTSATACAKNDTDLRYLGNENVLGEVFQTNMNNFQKTNYDFNNRNVISSNNNLCNNYKCPVSGTTVLISGVKVTKPVLKAHKVSDLINSASSFYYYPIALTVDAAASKGDEALKFNTVQVDIYLPYYMNMVENYGVDNEKHPVYVTDMTLGTIYNKFGLGTPASDMNYKIYRYKYTTGSSELSDEEKTNLQQGILSKFTVYADIDSINTPNGVEPEIFTNVDFFATKHLIGNDNNSTDITFNSIMPDGNRMDELNNIILYNSSAVITKATTLPKHIERGGTYAFNMLAYNHSKTVAEGGYTYPTADLYYILPYDGDLQVGDIGSKIGTTKYKVSFDQDSINAIQNRVDYKFYYATSGTPANIISDEIKTTSEPSSIWHEWTNPTEPVSNVIAVKVVKQSPYEPDTYFGSSSGLTVNIQTIGSTDGNAFYNSFHLLTTKPSNYTCEEIPDEPDYCTESRQTKANYASSSSVTSVYAREINGFVFEDYDYNGIYTSDESKLKDIPVSLYKKESLPEGYDPIDPTTFVSEDDELVSATVTSETGNYYFGGLSSGIYYVSFTIDNKKYIVADLEKIDDTIPDSRSNNSSASLLPNTNRAISSPIEFSESDSGGKITVSNINLGLAVKKEMALELNKYITEVTVTKNGKVETHDYSKQNLSKVSITVLNPKNTKVRVKYSFSVENTKYFPGYVGLIVDSMPQGMTFNPNLKENQYWVKYDNLLYYNGLGGKLLLPNKKQYFTLVLDLDLKEAGTYRNVVSARDLTLMGDELPVYDFSELSNSNNEGGN